MTEMFFTYQYMYNNYRVYYAMILILSMTEMFLLINTCIIITGCITS